MGTAAFPLKNLFDYDGDGKSDISVFRPAENRWYILQSSNSALVQFFFGAAGDTLAPADFDDDGKANVAVWRPSTGVWYLLQTPSGFGAVQPGAASDIPTEKAFLP